MEEAEGEKNGSGLAVTEVLACCQVLKLMLMIGTN